MKILILKSLVLFLLIPVLLSPVIVHAESVESTIPLWQQLDDPVVARCQEIIRLHSAILELKPTTDEKETYALEQNRLKQKISELVDWITLALSANNDQPLETCSKVWIESDALGRQALRPVCEQLLQKIKSQEILQEKKDSKLALITREYFPGYGNVDPEYQYRKGKELKRELIKTFWKDETLVWKQKEVYEGEISSDFLDALLSGDSIRDLTQGKPYQRMINGQFVSVVKVRFITKVKITTSCSLQYGDFKVWFELFKKKKGFFTGDDWTLCGKTYEVRREYTSESVVGPSAGKKEQSVLRASSGAVGANGRIFKLGDYHLHVTVRNLRMQTITKAYAKCSKSSTELTVKIHAPGYVDSVETYAIQSGVTSYIFDFTLKDRKPAYKVYNYEKDPLDSYYFQDDQSGTAADKYAVVIFVPKKIWLHPGPDSIYMNQEGYGWPIQESVEYSEIDVFYRIRMVIMREFADLNDPLLVYVKTTASSEKDD